MDEIIGLFSLSHEQNKARFNYAVARKQRRSQFKRMLNGYFFGCASARNLWGKSLIKYGRRPEIIYHSVSTNKIFN